MGRLLKFLETSHRGMAASWELSRAQWYRLSTLGMKRELRAISGGACGDLVVGHLRVTSL